jgi:hypothetical protein
MEKIKSNCFYWHPEAPDNNLNGGGEPADPGWIEIVADTYDEALKKLATVKPVEVNKIWARVFNYQKENGLSLEVLDYEECASAECCGGHPSWLFDWDNISALCCLYETDEVNVELTIE